MFSTTKLFHHCFSISAYSAHHRLQNVKPPVYIDITVPVEQWKNGLFTPNSCHVIYNANMIHIAPWATAVVSVSYNYTILLWTYLFTQIIIYRFADGMSFRAMYFLIRHNGHIKFRDGLFSWKFQPHENKSLRKLYKFIISGQQCYMSHQWYSYDPTGKSQKSLRKIL